MAKRKRREHRTHPLFKPGAGFCRFSTLDDLRGKDRGDPRTVLRVLTRVGRFSTFEVDQRLADALTFIQGHGWAVFDHALGFPWTGVKLTEAGNAEVNDASPA